MNCLLALIDLVRIITLTHIVDACHALSSDQYFSRQQRVVLSRECLVSALIPGNSIFIIAGGGGQKSYIGLILKVLNNRQFGQ